MFTRPTDLADVEVARALEAGWGLTVETIDYAPVGFGSHHWYVMADGQRWFVTVDDLDARKRDQTSTREDAVARLTAALTVALALRESGLEFVVTPRPERTGRPLHRINDKYAVAVYEHVAGESHSWGPYPSSAARRGVLGRLCQVHAQTACASHAAIVDDFVIPARDRLVDALGDRNSQWGPGPFAERARDLLRAHRYSVHTVLARYDALSVAVDDRRERFVLTHGEPHRANTIDTADGVVLIGWDTALLAPPERDLWMLVDEDPQIAEGYTELTGVSVESDALSLYRLWWDLCDISLYVVDLGEPHDDSQDMQVVWKSLQKYLDPHRWNVDACG